MRIVKHLQVTGLVLCVVAALAFPAVTWASCASNNTAPSLLLNSANTVPVNIGGIPWIGGFDDVKVERLDGAELVVVESTMDFAMNGDLVLIKPSDWAQGNTYRVTLEGSDIDSTIEVIAPFLLSGAPTLSVEYGEHDDNLGLELRAGIVTMGGLDALDDPELSPYLYFETLVDEVLWNSAAYCALGPHSGLSAWGPGVERLVGHCSSGEGGFGGGGFFPASSVLDVAMRVSIIGNDASLTTMPIIVDLTHQCSNLDGPVAESTTANTGDSNGDDGGCSSTSGHTGVLAFIGMIGFVGFFRRRRVIL